MKVYLLYSGYDDGQQYDSQGYDDLEKLVDSEEKAKKWIFEQAVEKCNKLASKIKEWLDGGELPEEEFEEDGYKEELEFYLNKRDKLKFGDDQYVIYDFNGYEKWIFTYEIKEVE